MHLKLKRINVIPVQITFHNISSLEKTHYFSSFKVKRLVLFVVKISLHLQACCLTKIKFVVILIIVSRTRMNHCDLQAEWQLTFTSRRPQNVQLPYNCTMYSTSSSKSKQHLYSIF
jgi:hypothetical protein